MVLDLHTFGFGCSLDATFVIPRGVFLSTISALELGLCGAVLCVMLSGTMTAGFCPATNWRDVPVGLTFETLCQSRLWAVVLSEVKGEFADEAALDNPVGDLLRRSTHYEGRMCFTRAMSAVEPGEPLNPEAIL